MPNEFVFTICNVVNNKGPPIWEFFHHMWDDKHLHVHVEFHEQEDSRVIMFTQVHIPSAKLKRQCHYGYDQLKGKTHEPR